MTRKRSPLALTSSFLSYERSHLPRFKPIAQGKHGELLASFLPLLPTPGGFRECVSSRLAGVVNANQEEALPSRFNLSGNNRTNGINGGALACSKAALMNEAHLSAEEGER